MPQTKLDRRVKYTKRVLRESLLELMKDKPITEISLTELCRKADINRNTFYAHYSALRDLLAEIEEELYSEVRDSIERSLSIGSIGTLLVEICHSIEKNAALCRILFSEHGDPLFLNKIVHLAHDKSLHEWRKASTGVPEGRMELLYTYFTHGCVAVIRNWIQREDRESPERIAEFIDTVSNRGLAAFLE